MGAILETSTSQSLEALVRRAEELASQDPVLGAARSRALHAHQAYGIPTTKLEDWRYTPVGEVLRPAWKPSVVSSEKPEEGDFLVPGSTRFVVANGRVVGTPASVSGLKFSSLRRDGQPSRLNEALDVSRHPFGSLAAAFHEDALIIEVPDEVELETPIEVLHLASGANEASAPRLLIQVGAKAKVQVVETYVGRGEGVTWTLPITEVWIGESAWVEHVRVQREPDDRFHMGLWEARQAASSTYLAYNIAFGGALARVDQRIVLQGENVTTRMDGVVAAKGEQLIDNHTHLDHAVPNCNSFEIYKHVLDDKAIGVFSGRIYVHPDAQKTDAKQTNQTLLLSRQAEIYSKPQLEIFADDVKCTHGATVGQIEDTSLFYLRSRGVPLEEAERILVYAFAAEVLELISMEPVRLGLERRLLAHVGG